MPKTLVTSLALVLIAASAARGDIFPVDDPNFLSGNKFPGDGSFTRDTAQGLDFLDVIPNTELMSWNTVNAELGAGGQFEGLRWATVAEVITLANNFGFSPAADLDTGGTGSSNIMAELEDLLGGGSVRQIGPPPQIRLLGSTGEEVNALNVRSVTFWTATAGNPDDVIGVGTRIKSASQDLIGHWLVREVGVIPEPSTYALLGFAGIGLAFYRWRRRRKRTA